MQDPQSQSTSEDIGFRLLDLLPEIRLGIYEYCFVTNTLRFSHIDVESLRTFLPPYPLLRSSRQIYTESFNCWQEAVRDFWRQHRFSLHAAPRSQPPSSPGAPVRFGSPCSPRPPQFPLFNQIRITRLTMYMRTPAADLYQGWHDLIVVFDAARSGIASVQFSDPNRANNSTWSALLHTARTELLNTRAAEHARLPLVSNGLLVVQNCNILCSMIIDRHDPRP
jgi:hypothetical protein